MEVNNKNDNKITLFSYDENNVIIIIFAYISNAFNDLHLNIFIIKNISCSQQQGKSLNE